MGADRKETEGKYNKYKRKLRINKESVLGRRLELAGDFDESFFRDNYYSAFALTMKIVEDNETTKKQWKTVKENYPREEREERLYNIITFCGERGTGKTSVMDSVVKMLQCSSKSNEYQKFIKNYEIASRQDQQGGSTARNLGEMMNSCEFICLDVIDASLLEEKEDILDVVLAKMLDKLQHSMKSSTGHCFLEMEHSDSYIKGDIYRKIEDICQRKRRLFWRMAHPYEPGESSTEELSNLAGSLAISEKLQKLIPVYLQALGNSHADRERQYLVISIDDLDMHRNAYQMLEYLHRYLMIPQVIIYVAVSEKEIRSACQRYFKRIYDNPAELAISYLEKVLPHSRRIYLPTTFTGDFFNVVLSNNSETDMMPVKSYLLKTIAQKTHVFYDGKGLETHFYESGNLRTLLNLYLVFEEMSQIENDNDTSFSWEEFFQDEGNRERLDNNFNKLKNDVIGRMAAEKLDVNEQRKIFQRYSKEDFSTNGEYLMEQIGKFFQEKDDSSAVNVYSYGELLYVLYKIGKKKQEFKPLIQCVLALSTIELTQNYMYAFYLGDTYSRKKWNEYIAGSICGTLGNKILPSVKVECVNKDNLNHRENIAYVKDCIINTTINTMIDGQADTQKEIGCSNSEKYDICKRLIEENELVESFELFMMFITKSSGMGMEKCGISLNNLQNNEDEKRKITFRFSNWECTFDFLGFVVNSMNSIEHLEEVRDILLQTLKGYCLAGGEERFDKDKEEELIGAIKRHSMAEGYEKWNKTYKGMALPIYSLDITYNVLKRAKNIMEEVFPRTIEKSDFLSIVRRCYQVFGLILDEEDDFYNKGKTEDRRISYTDFCRAFYECPFIGKIIGKDSHDKATISKVKENTADDRANEETTDESKKSESPLIMERDLQKEMRELLKEDLIKLPELFITLFNGFVEELKKG